VSLVHKKKHGPKLKCGGPSLCPDCRASAEGVRSDHELSMARARLAVSVAKAGDHAWFEFVLGTYDSCANCGIIRRSDDVNKPCPGKIRVGLR
jgi:hypothetical protein